MTMPTRLATAMIPSVAGSAKSASERPKRTRPSNIALLRQPHQEELLKDQRHGGGGADRARRRDRSALRELAARLQLGPAERENRHEHERRGREPERHAAAHEAGGVRDAKRGRKCETSDACVGHVSGVWARSVA